MATQFVQYPNQSNAQGPIEFILDGAPTPVSEDTITPANTVPLPVQIFGSVISPDVNIHDAAGNNLTSQVNGSQRALDVGIDVAGVQVDPRQIRALTSTDVVTADIKDSAGASITLGQKPMATSLPVAIASDQSAIPSSQSGTWSNRLQDGSGNPVTSQVNGSQRALDVGIDVAGVQVDPRQIRALTSADVVTANIKDSAGTSITLGQKTMASSLPVAIASDQSAVPASQSGTWTQRLQDGSGNAITSTVVGATRSLDVNTTAIAPATGRTSVTIVRNDYSSVNVTTAAYVQLIASTSATINMMDIFDSSGQTLVIAFGAAASEVNKFNIYPGGNGQVPITIPAGTRVSIKAISATANTGELDINCFS